MKQFSLLSRRAAALFLTPAGLLVGVFVLLPFFWVIIVSFTNRTLLGATAVHPDFVGLQNYIRLFNPSTFFTRGQFGSSLIITTQFVLLSALIGQALLYHLCFGGVQGVLGPIVVSDTWSKEAWGWTLSALMAGFVAGGLVALRWRPRHLLRWGVVMLSLTAAFPLALAAAGDLGVVLAGAFVHGVGLQLFSVSWDLAIQENVAPDKLARVYSFDMIGSFIARPVGLVLTGPLAALVGDRAWLTVVGVVIVASVLVATTSRDVRRLERREPVLEPVAPATTPA